MRPWRDETDLPLIVDLLRSVPLSSRHLIDIPWRLSSPALHTGRDARVWEDDDGKLVGFAAWQIYWAVLDYFVRPGEHQHSVETGIFSWAMERFRELDAERGRPLPYWVEFRDDDIERQRIVEVQGFLIDDDYQYIQMLHLLSEPLPEPTLPCGFTLRPIAGEREVNNYVELHRAAFESTSMTYDWRLRTLRMPQYEPDLDIVAVAPDGTLAGFCVGWLNSERHVGQVEPLGVHARFQHIGLGRALLLESLRCFKVHGADGVLVETENDRNVARNAYESIGFQSIRTIFRKGKWVTKPDL
jgi:GNAT superfamily N-acetyltransferase